MVWIIIIILSALDQLFKYLVQAQIAVTERITVIDSFFYLTYRKDTGGAWSFLAGPDWGFYILSGLSFLLSIAMMILIARNKSLRLRLPLAIIVSGSIGNLIDRVRLGFVVDYLDFHFGSYIFPTFNLADTLIVCGTILLCLFIIKDQSLMDSLIPDPKKQTARPHEDD